MRVPRKAGTPTCNAGFIVFLVSGCAKQPVFRRLNDRSLIHCEIHSFVPFFFLLKEKKIKSNVSPDNFHKIGKRRRIERRGRVARNGNNGSLNTQIEERPPSLSLNGRTKGTHASLPYATSEFFSFIELSRHYG